MTDISRASYNTQLNPISINNYLTKPQNSIDDNIDSYLKEKPGENKFYFDFEGDQYYLAFNKSTEQIEAKANGTNTVFDYDVQVNSKNTVDGFIEVKGLPNSGGEALYMGSKPNEEGVVEFYLGDHILNNRHKDGAIESKNLTLLTAPEKQVGRYELPKGPASTTQSNPQTAIGVPLQATTPTPPIADLPSTTPPNARDTSNTNKVYVHGDEAAFFQSGLVQPDQNNGVKPSSKEITVFNLNTHQGESLRSENHDNLINKIKDSGANVITLQEVSYGDDNDGWHPDEGNGKTQHWDDTVDFIQALSNEMGVPLYYTANHRGSLVISQFRISEAYNIDGNHERSTVHMLETPEGKMCVINNHLAVRRGSEEQYISKKIDEVDNMLDEVAQLKRNNPDMIFMTVGDFNLWKIKKTTDKMEAPFSMMIDGPFKDAGSINGVDYILIDDDLNVKSPTSAKHDDSLSDHPWQTATFTR